MKRTAVTLESECFVGDFAAPDETGKYPAVLVFSGSGGGHPGEGYLSELTQQGFAALALTYFNAPGLPDTLSRIPLEYFDTALSWLRSQENVDGSRVFVMSRSRGTEAAQLLAIRRPHDIAALVLGVPTYVVVKAYPGEGAAWTLDGNDVAYHPEGWPQGPFPLNAPAAIPLEHFPGRVLLIGAGEDQIWPSSEFCSVLQERRDRAGLTTETLIYARAEHNVGVLYPNLEGTSPNDEARADAWPRVIAFLNNAEAT